jgi:hypothetical protein
MAACNMCGIPSKACPVYSEKISICGDCSFKLAIVKNELAESIDMVQDIFRNCSEPRKLDRLFAFMARHISMMFEGIASGKVRRNIWNIISVSYGAPAYRLPSDELYEHPEVLESIKKNLEDDTYLLLLLGSDAFSFARDEDAYSNAHIPIDTMAADGPGMWNLGEQFILESMDYSSESNDEEDLY